MSDESDEIERLTMEDIGVRLGGSLTAILQGTPIQFVLILKDKGLPGVGYVSNTKGAAESLAMMRAMVARLKKTGGKDEVTFQFTKDGDIRVKGSTPE